MAPSTPPSPPSPSQQPLTTAEVRERIRRGSLTLSRGAAPLARAGSEGPSESELEAAWSEHTTAEGATYYFNALTRKTTWDTPTDFALRETRRRSGANLLAEHGSWSWVRDEIFCFAPAQQMDKEGLLFLTLDGREVRVEGSDDVLGPVLDIDRVNRDTDDMVKMQVINDATVLQNLRLRTERDDYFTNVGTILISVNPFKWIDKLYTQDQFALYRERAVGDEVPPHFFEVSDNAYRGLREDRKSQSIIISGESGSGKTEATKKCLQYLADVAGSSAAGLENKLLATNPVLEAFGNAKTLRNGNSSRFGKWTAVRFDGYNRIAGGRIVNYLLEKSRVATQIKGERNFHIFYQLVKGASDKQRASLRLPKACNVLRYLHAGACSEIPGVDDAEAFAETTEALDELGFTAREQTDILRVVAGTMWMGNLEFASPVGGNADDACELRMPASESAVKAVCELLGLDRKDLLSHVMNRIRTMGGQVIASPLNAQAAEESCAALAKEIYGRLFDWLVRRVNAMLAGDSAGAAGAASGAFAISGRMIGALDIFGFEIFEHNSFEQLCINYANEKLQQHFNQHTFKTEQKVYEAEGIDFAPPVFQDNADVLALLEERPRGLFVLLDEECVLPRGSDASYASKVAQFHGGAGGASEKANPRFRAGPKLRAKRELSFAVEHYAGLVVYSAEGFLEKNKDDLRENLVTLARSASNGLMAAELFPASSVEDDGTITTNTSAGSGAGKRRHKTQAGFFCRQLDDLMATLNDTSPHYIRCIKPNNEKAPDRFDPFLCLEQLRYSGVFEAIEIRKQGFPFRRLHDGFYRRYRVFASEEFKSRREPSLAGSAKDRCQALLEDLEAASKGDLKVDLTDCRIGRTMVLYRAPEHLYLEARREQARGQAGQLVVRVARGHLARSRVAAFRAVQSDLRAAIESRELMDISEAVADAEAKVKPPFSLHKEIEEARETMAAIEEELQLCAQVEDLESAIKSQPAAAAERYEEIEEVFTACENMQIAQKYPELEPVIADFDRRIQGVRDLIQAKKDLRAATHASYKPALVRAIQKAKALEEDHGSPFCEQELREARDRLDHVVREEKMIEALVAGLSKGGPQGRPGELDCTVIDDGPLRNAWTKAAAARDELTPRGKALADAAELVLALRESIKTADWVSTESLLARAGKLEEDGDLERFHIPHEEIDLCKDELACYTIVAEISSSIQHDAVGGDASEPDFAQASTARLREDIEDAKMLESPAKVAKAVIADAEKHARLRDAAMQSHWDTMASLLDSDHSKVHDGLRSEDPYARMYLDAIKPEHELLSKMYFGHVLETKASAALGQRAVSGKVGALKVTPHATRELDAVILWMKERLGGSWPSARSSALMILVQHVRSIRADLASKPDDFSGVERIYEARKLANKHGAPDACKDELSLVLHDLTEKECVSLLEKAAQGSGAITGSVGGLRVAGVDAKPLEQALEEAQAKLAHVGADPQPHSRRAAQMVYAIQELAQLRRAILGDDWDRVESVLLAGGDHKDPDDDPPEATERELQLIQDELNNRTIIAELTRALGSGGPRGPVGDLHLDGIEVDALQADVNDANELGCKTREAKDLLENANLVLRLRRGLVSQDWEMVEHALEEARFKRILPVAEAEVKVASKELHNRRILHALEHALKSGGPTGTVENLRVDTITFHLLDEALALAQKLRCESKRAQHLFGACKIVRAGRAALAEKRFLQLGQLVEDAQRQGFVASAADDDDDDVATDDPKREAVAPAARELQLMRDKFEDERMCHELAEALADGQPKGRIGAIDLASVKLGVLLKATEEYSVIEPRTTRAAQLLESAKVAVSLREALLAGPDWAAAEAVLERYSPEAVLDEHGFGLIESVEQEANLVRDELEHRAVLAILSDAIRHGAVSGSIGALDLDQLSVDVLNDAIEEVKRMNCKSPESKQLFETAKALRDVRACVAQADAATTAEGQADAVTWLGAVQVSLDKARKNPVAQEAREELKLVQDHVDDIKIARELCAALRQGAVEGRLGRADPGSCEIERLDAALQCVHTLVCKTERAKKLEKTGKLVAHFRKTLLADGWEGVPQLLEKHLGVSVQGGSPPDSFTGYADEAQDEFQRLVDECRERAAAAQLVCAVENGGVEGTPGEVNLTSLRMQDLERALGLAQRAGKHLSQTTRDLARLAGCLLLVRQGFEHGGRQRDEIEAIAAALARLPSFTRVGEAAIPERATEELELAQDHVNDYRIREAIREAVRTGDGGEPLRIAAVDATPLREALSAVKAGMGGAKSGEARDLVDGAELILRLRTALLARNFDDLRYILADAIENEGISRMPAAKDQVYHARGLLVSHDTVEALGKAVEEGSVLRSGGDADAVSSAALREALANVEKQVGGQYDPEVLKLCELCDHLAELRDVFQTSSSKRWSSVDAELTAMQNCMLVLDDQRRRQGEEAEGPVMHSEHAGAIDKVENEARAEFQEIHDRAEDRMAQRMIYEAMGEGCLQGRVGAISTASLSVSSLEVAVEAASTARRPSERTQAMLHEAKYLFSLRKAILAGNWQSAYDVVKHWRQATPDRPAVTSSSRPSESDEAREDLVRIFSGERSLAGGEAMRRVVVDELSQALANGGVRGAPGELSTQHVSVAQLNRAIARALEIGVSTPDAQQLMLAAHTVRQIRNGILANPDEGGGDGRVDCPLVRDALRICEEERDSDADLPDVARREITLIKEDLEDQDAAKTLADALAWSGPVGSEEESLGGARDGDAPQHADASGREAGDAESGSSVDGESSRAGDDASGDAEEASLGDEQRSRNDQADDNGDGDGDDDEEEAGDAAVETKSRHEVAEHKQDPERGDRARGNLAKAASSASSSSAASRRARRERKFSRYAPSRVSVERLNSAIAKTQEGKCHTVYSRALYKLAFFVRDLRIACLETAWKQASACISSIDKIRERVRTRAAPVSTQSGETQQWRSALALVQPEVERAREEIENLETVSQLRQALASGQAPGHFGYLRTDRVDLRALDKALGRASRIRCRSEEAVTLRKTAGLLRQLRAAVQNADFVTASVVLSEAQAYAATQGDGAAGPSPISRYHRLPVAGSEFELLHHEVENKLVCRALKTALRSGAVTGRVGAVSMTSSNVSGLERAMTKAESLARITDETRALVHSCRAVLQLRRILMDAMSSAGSLHSADETSLAPHMWEAAQQVLRNAVTNVPEGAGALGDADRNGAVVSTAPVPGRRRRGSTSSTSSSTSSAATAAAAAPALTGHALSGRPQSAPASGLSDSETRSFSLLWCHPEARGELALLLDEIQHREALQGLVRALTSGHAKFLGGFVDVATVKTGALEAAIATAKKVPSRTDELTSLQLSASIILRCREALLDGSWQDLDNMLRDCVDLRIHEVAADEMNMMRREAHLHNVIKSVLVRLQDATKARDVDALERALEEAETLRLGASPDLHVLSRVNKARQLLDRLMVVDERLDQCVHRADLRGLEASLEEARRLKYSPRAAAAAIDLRDRLQAAYSQAERAVQTVDATAMRALLEQARRERIDLPRMEEMRRLLSLPPAQLERLRLNAAVERGDEDTVVDVTTGIKTRFFEQEATREKHRLELFPALKSPAEFAANTGAVAPGLASGMLSHSSSPIPTSLTRLPSTPATSLAVKVFRALLGYMGDREYSYPASLAQEILQVGLAVTELRDEILLQMVKQLSDNSSPKSRQRGWLLLSLALRTFPPSELFENFFELWLRRKGVELRARAGSSETNNWAHLCLNQMHRIVFRGPADAIPPLDEVHHLLNVNPSEHSRLTASPASASARKMLPRDQDENQQRLPSRLDIPPYEYS